MKLENLHGRIATHGVPFLQIIVNVSNVRSTGFLMFLCSYIITIRSFVSSIHILSII